MSLLAVSADEEVRKLLEKLAAAGVDCRFVPQGMEAFEILSAKDGKKYDVVLLDEDLPGLSGQALAGALKATPDIATPALVLLRGEASGLRCFERPRAREPCQAGANLQLDAATRGCRRNRWQRPGTRG